MLSTKVYAARNQTTCPKNSLIFEVCDTTEDEDVKRKNIEKYVKRRKVIESLL